jgi:predicted SnoaL-like aldol condensation-catalyzing enzyme
MIELVDPNDSRAVRNKNNVIRFYDLVINQKKSEESIATFMTPGYIQHNPLIPDGAEALGKFFGQITKERTNARVVVDKIIAVGDYVFAHVNFLNLFSDDPEDTGIAGVDIYRIPTEEPSSIGIRCNRLVTQRIRLHGSLPTSLALIHTACSKPSKENV